MAKLLQFRILKIKHFVIFTTILIFSSCQRQPNSISKIEGKQIAIDSSWAEMPEIKNFIAPYHNRVNTMLDSTLAYAPYKITKDDGAYNTTAGNLMADLMLSEANPIFKKRTGKEIDFVLMNHGGIRSIISQGNVSARTAYEVMPFENNIAVVELNGKSVLEMIHYIIQSKRAHPLGGIQVVLNKDDSINKILVQGKAFVVDQHYYIATSDYLVSGGDDMVFFKDAITITDIDYKIRNAMIDYFSKVDTLSPKVDDRFYKLN
ncbi:5'-nucleotidase C-terminal domain-containing protein [Maribacter aestuarii]|uniref:5'-nucleotidase C-terminal domain-containing protein n=1 Tax=Maribacter aestuarii TaxID=1130723 RepID=UPI00248AEFC0|nr:5'-nucleotidase [Maribacter aestuarii]